jgi:hypothetical protein
VADNSLLVVLAARENEREKKNARRSCVAVPGVADNSLVPAERENGDETEMLAERKRENVERERKRSPLLLCRSWSATKLAARKKKEC